MANKKAADSRINVVDMDKEDAQDLRVCPR
jgi:hypothetical protein